MNVATRPEPGATITRRAVNSTVRFAARAAAAAGKALGSDSALVRALDPAYQAFLRLAQGGNGVPRLINGVTYLVDLRYYRGPQEHEAQVAAFLRDRVRPGDVCFDVGANIGLYVLQFAHWSSPHGRVVAFEPNPAALLALERHLEINRIQDRVELVPLAVGAACGEAPFYALGASSEARLGTPSGKWSASASELRVKVVTLDEWSESHRSHPDWLLIDVEGFEIEALKGARNLILRRGKRPRIVVEMHPQFWHATRRDEAETLFKDLGLTPVPLTGQRDPLAEYGLVFLAGR